MPEADEPESKLKEAVKHLETSDYNTEVYKGLACVKYPCCRGDYRLLEKYVWRDFYGIPFGLFEKVRRIPSGGTVDRRWREVFAEAKASFELAVSQGDLVAAKEAHEELRLKFWKTGFNAAQQEFKRLLAEQRRLNEHGERTARENDLINTEREFKHRIRLLEELLVLLEERLK